ncbi:MAG: ATP-binding protein [Elusimicrobiota bacterium]
MSAGALASVLDGQANPMRILIMAWDMETVQPPARSLEAFGCKVELCERETVFWDKLQSGVWDVILWDMDPGDPPGMDFLYRAHALQPAAALWLAGEAGGLPESLEPMGREKFVRFFPRPLSAEALFGALPQSAPAVHDESEKVSILLVHPDPLFGDVFAGFLAMEGHTSMHVTSGADALEQAKQHPYHVALVDASLPETTVWDLASRLHEIRPDLAVVVMSDYASLDSVLKSMRADVFDYLLKPLDAYAFQHTLRKVLEKRRLNGQIQSLLDGLKKANQDLSRLSELKSRFLRLVTHDLRAPLTAIKGYTMAMQSGMIAPNQIETALGVMVRESESMERLIEDLMDFAAMETGKLRLEKTSVDPRALFAAAVDRFRLTMEKQKLRFDVQGLDQEWPPLNADPRRLEQVLGNLIGNAVKHTPEGGSVTVRFLKRPEELEVRVEDSGEGMDPRHLPRLFGEFYQVEGAANQRKGLGLGLAIAREIVTGHGGRIGASSEGPGKGAQFWFTLPFAKDGKPAAAAASAPPPSRPA